MMTSEGKFNLFKDTNLYTTENKIKSFRELQRGWNYGKGNLPNDLTLQTAIELNRKPIILDSWKRMHFLEQMVR